MSDQKPQFNCGDALDCCGGADYPVCQLIETSDGRNYTIRTDEPAPFPQTDIRPFLARIKEIAGDLADKMLGPEQAAHYDDGQHSNAPYRFTD